MKKNCMTKVRSNLGMLAIIALLAGVVLGGLPTLASAGTNYEFWEKKSPRNPDKYSNYVTNFGDIQISSTSDSVIDVTIPVNPIEPDPYLKIHKSYPYWQNGWAFNQHFSKFRAWKRSDGRYDGMSRYWPSHLVAKNIGIGDFLYGVVKHLAGYTNTGFLPGYYEWWTITPWSYGHLDSATAANTANANWMKVDVYVYKVDLTTPMFCVELVGRSMENWFLREDLVPR
ncbi:MAG: hypothetical protein SWH78_06420 [Thermodesulfobacteriota bacterium]|nr:hypothetical protein [Thermodesulfobacteriota bacterium]